MDADLEAILAESDSDDGLGEGGLSLEDILKEDGASSPLQEYRAPQANTESRAPGQRTSWSSGHSQYR